MSSLLAIASMRGPYVVGSVLGSKVVSAGRGISLSTQLPATAKWKFHRLSMLEAPVQAVATSGKPFGAGQPIGAWPKELSSQYKARSSVVAPVGSGSGVRP